MLNANPILAVGHVGLATEIKVATEFADVHYAEHTRCIVGDASGSL